MTKIMLDTDLGCDCDDAGAVAVLCHLAKSGKAEILSVTHTTGSRPGHTFLIHELRFFGYGDLPVGVRQDDFLTDPIYEQFSRPYCERMRYAYEEREDAVRVLRRTLAANGGNRDITLCAIGPLRNLGALVGSGADDISPLSGVELLAKNVTQVVCMAGNFTGRLSSEWNVKMDIPAARAFFSRCPVPILFAPDEIGRDLKTGALLDRVPEDHPVRAAYTLFSGESHMRSSWDLVAVYAAVCGAAPYWEEVPVQVDAVEETGALHTVPGDGMRRLVQVASNEAIAALLDPLML